MTKKSQNSLREIVGDEVYSVWIDMLKRLVPDGRTHRLAPAIASMLKYASEVAYEKYGGEPEEGSAAYSLIATEDCDYEESANILLPIVESLLKDSKVQYKRKSAKGMNYSIAEAAVREFVNWYSLPWEE